jgi:hypothetical protein
MKMLGRGLSGRLLSYGALLLGFWLLLRAFMGPNILLGILGGLVILVGMYIMVSGRRTP